MQPDESVLQRMDALIDASTEVPLQDKLKRRPLLRVLFWLGEELKSRGVEEEFIRSKVKTVATTIAVAPKPWALAQKKLDVFHQQWKAR